MSEFRVGAARAPDWDNHAVRRRLGRADALILFYGEKKETVDPSETAQGH